MKCVLMSGSYKKMEIYDNIINLINSTIKKDKNISFISCDFDDYEGNDHFKNKLLNLFKDKNICFNKIYLIDNRLNKNQMKESINNSSIVFLLGGDTLKQIDNINKYKLKTNIKKALIVIGMSAGSINMAKRVVLAKDEDDNINNLSIYNGIGLVNINIEPHCDFNNIKHFKEIEEASVYSDIVVMNDDAYIIVDKKKTYYGKYIILKNKKVYYKNKKITLKYFVENIIND